ncbi:MAG: hypothetical protein U0Z44_09930 [Kouleothrix sp.]
MYDSDDDGLSDLAERQLAQGAPAGRSDADGHAYHPLVFNRAPVIIRNDISDPDRIVAPGQTFTYTTTVASAGPALAPGALDIAAPSVLGGTPAPAKLDFSVSQTVTVQAAMTVARRRHRQRSDQQHRAAAPGRPGRQPVELECAE